jgi:hypothetical protein
LFTGLECASIDNCQFKRQWLRRYWRDETGGRSRAGIRALPGLSRPTPAIRTKPETRLAFLACPSIRAKFSVLRRCQRPANCDALGGGQSGPKRRSFNEMKVSKNQRRLRFMVGSIAAAKRPCLVFAMPRACARFDFDGSARGAGQKSRLDPLSAFVPF